MLWLSLQYDKMASLRNSIRVFQTSATVPGFSSDPPSFIQYSVCRQVQSLLQNDSSTQCDLELSPSSESILSCPYGHPVASYVFFLVFLSLPSLLLILLHHRPYQRGWGWRQHERYVKSNLPKTASFIVVESLGVSPEHIHLQPIHCLDPSERVAWLKFPYLSVITCCQNSKSGRCRLTAWSKLIG